MIIEQRELVMLNMSGVKTSRRAGSLTPVEFLLSLPYPKQVVSTKKHNGLKTGGGLRV